jgi:2-desacetyl-2-hydroxyethyl bacteriochlorophyllide A dehydrogenase
MRAAVTRGPGRLEVVDVPVPEIGPGDVLVAVDLCGVCGSDLHMVLEGWARPDTIGGHEWVGRVVEVGSDVTRWSVDDLVVGGPPPGCGDCPACQDGRPSLCAGRDAPGVEDPDGAFAEYRSTPEGELLPLPPGVDLRTAALTEPLAVALHAIAVAAVRPGHRVLVMGAGPIGALVIAALVARGVDDVECVEPNPARAALAEAVGARRIRTPEELVVPSIAEPGLIVDGAYDVVLECSGKAVAMEAGLAQLVRGGTLVLVGAGIEPPRFDPNRILLNELVITGAFNYDADGFEDALALLASGRLPVDDLLEPGDVRLDGLLDSMRDLAAGRVAGKVLVRP